MFLFPGGSTVSSVPGNISLTDSPISTAGATTYTFSSVALGAAATDRLIAVIAYGGLTFPLTASSLVIGGVSASAVVQGGQGAACTLEIWIATVPTGTTGDIVVTWGGAELACGLGVYRITGCSSTATDTASQGLAHGNATDLVGSVNVLANGVCLAGTGDGNSAGTKTYTWSGLTEDFDEVVNATQHAWHSGASANISADESPRAISAAEAVAGHRALVAASFPPV